MSRTVVPVPRCDGLLLLPIIEGPHAGERCRVEGVLRDGPAGCVLAVRVLGSETELLVPRDFLKWPLRNNPRQPTSLLGQKRLAVQGVGGVPVPATGMVVPTTWW